MTIERGGWWNGMTGVALAADAGYAAPLEPEPLDSGPALPVSERWASLRVAGSRTPRRVDRLVADLRTVRGAHQTAAHRLLPVRPELRPILPWGGLRRGTTVVAVPAATSVMLALIAAASAAGSWCGVVGMPTLNAIAVAEQGIALDRLACVPDPGQEWAATVAALLDGLDIVVAAPPGPVARAVADRLAARARQCGSVLVPYGRWQGADLTIAAIRSTWHGLALGRGRLRRRELTLRAWGRGAASTPKEINVWLPD